ncbi:MAG: pyridoxal phosphate-dependent aminotransferase [Bacteroidia bacterium]|nr:pyridoxal phosphate-dependent aminotransferase [Bacteroidia bacterium]
MKLAERINALSESQTIAMARKSRELKASGIDIISLSLGEPDFRTPDKVKEAAKEAIDTDFSYYTHVSGYQELREAIALKFKRDNGLDYKPDQIVVSTGAKQCIANAVLSLVNPGEEVIVPAPYWVSYLEIIKLAEGKPVVIQSGLERNFKVTGADIRKVISPKTRMLIFSSPCNPTGSVYTRQELQDIADALAGYPEIYIISDEIYEHINFAGKHESIAQFPSVRDRVITINGVSKAFAMTGWRVGYMGAAAEIAKACDKMQGQFTSATCSIAQKATHAAVLMDPREIMPMRDAFRKRRDLCYDLMKDIPGMKTNLPEGAFYFFPEVSSYFGKTNGNTVIRNGTDLCMYLLDKAHVALVPGAAFGDDRYLRFSYATSEANLREAIRRMKLALEGLS